MNIQFGSIVPIEKTIFQYHGRSREDAGSQAGNSLGIYSNTLNPPHHLKADPQKVNLLKQVAPDYDPAVGVMFVESNDKTYIVTGKEYTKAKEALRQSYIGLWENAWRSMLSPTTFNPVDRIRMEAEKVIQTLLTSPETDIKPPVTYITGNEQIGEVWKDVEAFTPYQA